MSVLSESESHYELHRRATQQSGVQPSALTNPVPAGVCHLFSLMQSYGQQNQRQEFAGVANVHSLLKKRTESEMHTWVRFSNNPH